MGRSGERYIGTGIHPGSDHVAQHMHGRIPVTKSHESGLVDEHLSCKVEVTGVPHLYIHKHCIPLQGYLGQHGNIYYCPRFRLYI